MPSVLATALLVVMLMLLQTFVSSTHTAPSASNATQPSDFSYEPSNPVGPLHWSRLAPLCRTGQHQSPVNFNARHYDTHPGARPTLRWPRTVPHTLWFKRTPHTVQVDVPSELRSLFGMKGVDGEMYYLEQFHFHAPSEHHRNGRFYPAEIHFVHRSKHNKLSVLGFFLQNAERSSKFFHQVLHKYPTATRSIPLKHLVLAPFIHFAANTDYWTYNGSLTIPPCTEGVLWTVAKTPVNVNFRRLDGLAEALGFSARPTQENDDKSGR
ncbi:hypothetical protein HDU96_007092 [Phlyctochytrium bullatum]|nr:hypothetical protein HDU96_007092 [Phlyctochytrium bullatum]